MFLLQIDCWTKTLPIHFADMEILRPGESGEDHRQFSRWRPGRRWSLQVPEDWAPLHPGRHETAARHVSSGGHAERRGRSGHWDDQQARRNQGLQWPEAPEQGHVVDAADFHHGALVPAVVWRDDAHLHHLHSDIGARLMIGDEIDCDCSRLARGNCM